MRFVAAISQGLKHAVNMFQSYSNNLSLQNKRTEIVASLTWDKTLHWKSQQNTPASFGLPLQQKTPIVTNYLFASSILRNTQLTIQSFDKYLVPMKR